MSVIPKIPRASGGALPPWAPYQGSTLDQLGTLSGPQTPRLLTPPNHKSWIVWLKIVIFHTKYPNNFRGSLRNWKKYDFLA